MPTTTPDTATTAPAGERRYLAPGRADHAFNRVAGFLTRRGLSLAGSRQLRVVGRTSGEVRTTTVNLLEVDGRRYLVAPRGHTQWVRNLRVAGTAELVVGRRREAVRAVELPDDGLKVALVQAYVARWGWEVGRFLDGIDASSSDDEVRAALPGIPAFSIEVL